MSPRCAATPVDVWSEEEPLLVAVDGVHVIVQAPVVVEAPEAGGLGTVSTVSTYNTAQYSTVHHSTVQHSTWVSAAAPSLAM